MKRSHIFFPLLLAILVTACKDKPAEKPVLTAAPTSVQKDSVTIDSTLAFKTFNYEGYSFKYRYLKHESDEDGGGENPAIVQVYKSDKLIFTDSFKAEGDIYIDTLGYQAVSGRKLFVKVNYGIEACDYVQSGRYYFVSPDGAVHYLGDFGSVCGGDGYSCRNYQHYFPGDSNGVTDKFRVIETMHYNEHDHPDQFDTTDWQFEGDRYNLTKQTHHLAQ